MDIKLTRINSSAAGVFGHLYDDNNNFIAVSLEHGYDSGLGNGSYTAKVAPGTYICLRHAPNRLPYETFELQNVPPFQGQPVTGILIHCGNFDKDSEGCILLGEQRNGDMVTNSRLAFSKFMGLQSNNDSFTITIE